MNFWQWVAVVVLLLFAFGVRLRGTAVLGLQADEGVHLFAAERVAAGDVLYRDLFENRTPGVEWLLAGVFELTGAHYFVGRLLTVLAALVTIAGLVAAGKAAFRDESRRTLGVSAGLIAGLLFAVSPLPIFWSRYTMLEPFETAVAMLSIACALIGLQTGNNRWCFAASGFVGLAILCKQSGFVLLPLHAGLVGWLVLRRQISLKGVGAWGVGIGVVFGVFTAVLLLQGAAADFLYLLSGADRLSPMAGLGEKIQLFGGWMLRQPSLVLSLIGAVFVLWRRETAALFLLGWVIIEIVVLFLPSKLDLDWGGFSHYVLPVVAAASLLAGVGLVVGWQLLANRRVGRVLAGVGLLVAMGLVLPAWGRDFEYALRKVAYPQPDIAVEQNIGRAVSLVTEENQPIVVFANGGFYHWANRKQASKFFHVPAFLADSYLADEVNQSLAAALADLHTGAVLASRMHLEERVAQPVLDVLWRQWLPVHLFWYPYQNDVLLFMRRPLPSEDEPLAVYEGGVGLTAVNSQKPDESTLLVQLEWTAQQPQEQDYKVFVHVLRPDGTLAAQSDAVPMAGYAPVSGWQVNTAVPDWHWIDLPEEMDVEDVLVSIGLYDAETGRRLFLQTESGAVDAFVMPLEP